MLGWRSEKTGNLRILLIAGSMPPMKCGVGNYTAHLAKALGERGDVSVACLTDAGAGQDPSDPSFERYPVANGWTPSDFPAIAGTIRAWKPDIVHVQYPTQGYKHHLSPFFLPAMARLLGVPVVQTWHEHYEGIGLFALSANAWTTDTIIVVRPGYEKGIPRPYRSLLGKKHFEFIPNASTIKTFRMEDAERSAIRSLYSEDSKRLIAYFGFAYRHKGVDLLFEIADPAVDHLVLICELNPSDDYHREILSLVRGEKWSRHATVTGFLPEEDAGRLLAAADAVVFPFRKGGGIWNTTLQRASAQGTFVLTTSTEKNGYDPSGNIYHARPGDVTEMRKALETYAGRRNSPVDISDDWRLISESHVRLYRRTLKSRRSGA